MNTLYASSPDGARVAYDRSGAGSAIVLLHGGGGTRQEWHEAGYVRRLRDRYTVIAVDLRGHGESSLRTDPADYSTDKLGQDILAVADACGVDRFAMWGVSYGGKIGRYLAAQSERVVKFVMIGTPLGPGVSGERRRQAVDFFAHWPPIVHAQGAGTLDLDALSPDDRDFLRRFNVPVMLAWVRAMMDWPAIEPADFRCPTLWVVGSEDRYAMASLSEYKDSLQGSRLQVHIVQGLDHERAFDEIDRVFPTMLAFTKSSSMYTLRPYHPADDKAQVYGLWQRALGGQWPLSQSTFHAITIGNPAYQAGDHLVALSDDDNDDDKIVGFAGTQSWSVPGEPVPCGEILLVMVDPAYRRRGVGRALLKRALVVLKRRGVNRAQLGGGAFDYFWPGVPADLSGAWPFFEACGWEAAEHSYDLVLDLDGYATPPGIYERIRLPSITIETARPKDGPALLAFEGQHFPAWLHYYQEIVERGGCGDVVVARHPERGIVGTSCAEHPHAPWRRGNFVWALLLGEDTGCLGPLGVAASVRENGIGLAIAARVTELLRERGAARSYVGWTWLVDWYGRLGYKVWQEYVMSWKTLSADVDYE
jgi:pimeloyl-ACP methyl ester carboxylesterase/GNAT superfamily N-acetyltransferase